MRSIKKNIVDEAWTNIVRLENLHDKIYDTLPENTRIELVDYITMSIIDAGNIIANCYNIDMSEEDIKCALDDLLEDAAEKYRKENSNANVEKLELPDYIHEALLKFPMKDQETLKDPKQIKTISKTFNTQVIKFYDDETVIIDSAFEAERILKFALKHNFNICYTDTNCTRALEDIAEIQSHGYHIKIKRFKNMSPDGQFELTPNIVIFATKHPIIPVKEYNQTYVGQMDRASLCCDWEHICNTLYKCDDHDGAVEQLKNGLGWGPEVTETIKIALQHYKNYLYSCFPE